MQIGVFVQQIERETLDEQLKAWMGADITAIECYYPPLVENPLRVLEGWAHAFSDAGVRFWSVHAPFGSQHNLAHPERRKRFGAVEFHKFVMERVHVVGANIMVIHPASSVRTDAERVKALDWLRGSLDELLPFAEELGIVLALENMLPETAGSDPAELSRFIAAFFSPNLGLCFDTGHAHIAGNVYLWLESVQPSIATYHIADNDSTWDMHLQPGYGTVPWDLLSPILQQADFPLIVETQRWRNMSWRRFREEVEAVLTGQVVTVEVNGSKGIVRCFKCGQLLLRSPNGSVSCACEH